MLHNATQPCEDPRKEPLHQHGGFTHLLTNSLLTNLQGVGSLLVTYDFPAAPQTARHPNPNVLHQARRVACYYPDDDTGAIAVRVTALTLTLAPATLVLTPTPTPTLDPNPNPSPKVTLTLTLTRCASSPPPSCAAFSSAWGSPPPREGATSSSLDCAPLPSYHPVT